MSINLGQAAGAGVSLFGRTFKPVTMRQVAAWQMQMPGTDKDRAFYTLSHVWQWAITPAGMCIVLPFLGDCSGLSVQQQVAVIDASFIAAFGSGDESKEGGSNAPDPFVGGSTGAASPQS